REAATSSLSFSEAVCGTMTRPARRADRAPGRCRAGAGSTWRRTRTGRFVVDCQSSSGSRPRTLLALVLCLKLAPPGGGLLRLGALVVQPDQRLERLDQAGIRLFRHLHLTLLHPLIALDEQRLGLGVLLLEQQRFAEQRLRAERRPRFG